MTMVQGKTFYLGIGAPRCGTTWLYRNLRQNSDLYLPPIKELRFFKGLRSAEQRAKLIADELPKVPAGSHDAAFYKAWEHAQQAEPSVYLSLFPDLPKVGEISPIYCTMAAPHIARIKSLFPKEGDAKVFLMLRNPLDRDISHIIFSMHRQRGRTKSHTEAEYMEFIEHKVFIQRSQYTRAHRLWSEAFGDDLNIFYYDDLDDDPVAFYQHFCSTMKIEPGDKDVATNMINTSGSSRKFSVKLPDSVIEVLYERNRKQVERMAFLPNERRGQWLNQMGDKIRDVRNV